MQGIKNRITELRQQSLDFDRMLELGNLYLQLGDKIEARYYYKQIISHFPTRAEGYHFLGKLLLEEHKIKEANDYLSKALDRNPKSIDILISLSELHLQIKGYDRAHGLLEKIHAVAPKNPMGLYLLGKHAYFQNDLFHTSEYLTQALIEAEFPLRGDINYLFAIMYTQQGFYTKALDQFEQCKKAPQFHKEHKEKYYHLYHNIAYCHFRLGNYGIAHEIYEKLLSEDITLQSESLINLAELCWVQNKTEQAISYFHDANKANPKAWPWMRELHTYTTEGEKWLQQAIQEIPKETSSNLNYAMYLGCVIPNRYPYIDAASRHVLGALGAGLVEMEGAGCCPAPGVFRSFDLETWLALGARNITIAEELERNLCIMCNGCYGTLNDVNTELQKNETKRNHVNEILKEAGVHYKGTVDAEHIVWILYHDIGMDKLKEKLKIPLDYKVAVHYGCHILKPIHNKPWKDSFETPTFLDDIVELTGCKSIPHRDKLMCCGAGGGLRGSEKEISLDFTRDKLEAYREAGVDIIITCCPFCHLQLDLGQVEVNKIFKDKISAPFQFPVIYITQLLGIAMGIDPYRLGLQKQPQPKGIPPFVPVDSIFTQYFKQL